MKPPTPPCAARTIHMATAALQPELWTCSPMNSFERIAVVGLGYIGLPTAAVFAENGIEVVGVDVNEHVVNTVNEGRPHFGEPNLDALIRRVVESGKLRASTEVELADAFIIAVPTPLDSHDQSPVPDLSYVEAATLSIAPILKSGNLVVLESTSPVGT